MPKLETSQQSACAVTQFLALHWRRYSNTILFLGPLAVLYRRLKAAKKRVLRRLSDLGT